MWKRNSGVTLHGAVRRGEEQLVLQLLKVEASPNEQDASGNTPLHIAASRGHEVVLTLMLSQRAHTDMKDSMGRTALHLAAENGFVRVTELLLAAGSNPNLRQCGVGESPLDSAVRHGHVDVA